jgi:magnesium chelatase subunit I
VLQLGETASGAASIEGFRTVPALLDVVRELGLGREDSAGHTAAACELVLEALVADRRLSRSDAGGYARGARRPPPTGGSKPFLEA